ncbi:MAG: hypothetical protein AAGG56_03870 [Pseudomonadota bacterium]
MAKDANMSQATYDRLKQIGQQGGTESTTGLPHQQAQAIINAVNDGKNGK